MQLSTQCDRVLFTILCFAASTVAACSNGDSSGIDDADGDGVADTSDNCPAIPNPQQADQDFDGVGDSCDASNDNPVIAVANPDLEGTDRDPNTRTCSSDEFLSGITLGFATTGYVDTVFYRCTKRFAPFATTEGVGETASSRGADLDCDSGEVLIGLAYKDADGSQPPNDVLDSATILCVPAAGPDTNPRLVPNDDFESNPSTPVVLQCPEGATAAGIVDIDSDTSSNNSDAIDGIGLRCREGRWISEVG